MTSHRFRQSYRRESGCCVSEIFRSIDGEGSFAVPLQEWRPSDMMSSAFGGMHDDDEVEASSSDRHGWGTQRREPCVCSIWASKSGLLTCGSVYVLRVCQQPESARLSSYKEENETSEQQGGCSKASRTCPLVDRRPVDPPPVVELQTYNNDIR